MIKILGIVTLVSCSIPFISNAQDYSLHALRHEFYLCTLDYQYAFSLIEKLDKISEPSALELAYKAATQAILAKPGWNLFKKLRYLRRSRDSFEKAIDSDLEDLEIRFLRLSIEHHIPNYLGFSKNIAKDKQVIIENIERFRKKELPQEITDYIIRFSIESGIYTNQEIQQIKYLLERH